MIAGARTRRHGTVVLAVPGSLQNDGKANGKIRNCDRDDAGRDGNQSETLNILQKRP